MLNNVKGVLNCKHILLSLLVILNTSKMEVWASVVGFENQYEVSSLGNIRSIDRYVKHHIEGVNRMYKGTNKKTRLNSKGYVRCNLKNDGKRYDFTVHRLVAEAFIPNPENKPQINHINGIKTDNRIENLEWCTQSENNIHATKNRLVKTKLTDKEAMDIYNSELSLRKLAKMYNVCSSIIWRIKNQKAYKHLWKHY